MLNRRTHGPVRSEGDQRRSPGAPLNPIARLNPIDEDKVERHPRNPRAPKLTEAHSPRNRHAHKPTGAHSPIAGPSVRSPLASSVADPVPNLHGTSPPVSLFRASISANRRE